MDFIHLTDLLILTSKKLTDDQIIWKIQYRFNFVYIHGKGCVYGANNYEKVDINRQNEKGETVLMDATYLGYENIVKILLDKGSDINIKHICGWSALMIGLREIIKRLRECYKNFKNKKHSQVKLFYRFLHLKLWPLSILTSNVYLL